MKWYQHIFGKEQVHAKYFKGIDESKSANLEKWGKSAETNVAYMTTPYGAYDGLARGLLSGRDKNGLVSLGRYLHGDETLPDNDKFTKYLNKVQPNWKKMKDMDPDSNEFRKEADKFRKNLEDYGKQEFKSGNKVLAYGSAIADKRLSSDFSFYKNKPTIVTFEKNKKTVNRYFPKLKSNLMLLFATPFEIASRITNRKYNKNRKAWSRIVSQNSNNRQSLSEVIKANENIPAIRDMIEEAAKRWEG